MLLISKVLPTTEVLHLENFYNNDLFDSECKIRSQRLARLNKTFDLINSRYGGGSISIAKENYERLHLTKRTNLSPAYTSNFDELAIAN